MSLETKLDKNKVSRYYEWIASEPKLNGPYYLVLNLMSEFYLSLNVFTVFDIVQILC